jgi:leader peptidase (prepilin peptidase)/N-methyltransferase
VPATAGLIGLRLVYHPWPLWHYAVGGAGALAIVWALRTLSRGGMGFGDVKLFGMIGVWLGLTGAILTLVGAAVLGLMVGGLLWVGRRLGPDHRIPFGPAVAVAAVGIALWGRPLESLYRLH